ncbi:MAG: sigma-54 dependent transcriptional regulator [Deltaproteobacteria bacterium]|nr:sigma-54 dependent transcriptional regulator [Deltaproteobacteria bacterium]
MQVRGREILVVDDEPDNLDLIVRTLRGLAPLVTATSGAAAVELLRHRAIGVIVTDHAMPGLTGVELLERATRIAPSAARILVTAYGDADVLTDAINRGHATHVLAKPIEPRELREIVARLLATPSARRALVLAPTELAERIAIALRASGMSAGIAVEQAEIDDEIAVWPTDLGPDAVERVRNAVRAEDAVRRQRGPFGLAALIGQSDAMREVFDTLEQVAGTDATVLVRGETGTGKELVARVLHSLSSRRDRPFVAVNCAALPESLVESELFGHERGAFTGAAHRKLGRFERADGGTLFIDEVADIPEAVQIKLLRVLQERSLERVGGTELLKVDIRLVAATHIDLEDAIREGKFREDLYYRLDVVPITLPPLRDRREDIPLLVEHLLSEYQRRLGKTGIRLAPEAQRRLIQHDWPGNVRELSNAIERLVALTPAGATAQTVELRSRTGPRAQLATMIPEPSGQTLGETVDEFERAVIAQALERTANNRSAAARALGISRQGLALKLKKYRL